MLHPMEAKKRLARTITAGFHGEAAALAADENWARMFQQKETMEDLKEVAQSLSDVGMIEQAPMMEGRTMLVVIGPAKAKPAKKDQADA